MHIATTPRVGEIIDGLTVGALMIDQRTGQPYALLVNPARPESLLDWNAANVWATSLGDGFHLPSRPEGAALYANNEQLGTAAFDPEWHWLNEQYSARGAWRQGVGRGPGGARGGHQSYGRKYNKLSARAVRRVDIAPQDNS